MESAVYNHPEKGLIMKTDMSRNRMFYLLANMISKVSSSSSCFQTISEDYLIFSIIGLVT